MVIIFTNNLQKKIASVIMLAILFLHDDPVFVMQTYPVCLHDKQ